MQSRKLLRVDGPFPATDGLYSIDHHFVNVPLAIGASPCSRGRWRSWNVALVADDGSSQIRPPFRCGMLYRVNIVQLTGGNGLLAPAMPSVCEGLLFTVVAVQAPPIWVSELPDLLFPDVHLFAALWACDPSFCPLYGW